jgi:hypothetical protein
MSSPSLRDYFLLEARHAPLRVPLAMALWGVSAVFGTHALLVRFPERVIHFLEQAFRLDGIAAVLLINDVVAAYFATFFVGIIGLLTAVVNAREEAQLELLLAKPIRPRAFLAARVGPVLAGAAAAGLLIAGTTALAIRPYLARGDQVTAAGALGAGLFLVALALVMLAALLILLVRMRDSFHALLVASFVWLAPMIPTATFIYRPDVFDNHPMLRGTIVMATLLWHDATSTWLGPLALAAALPLTALCVALAGRVLEKTDVN